jgi:hypothetical protein
MKSYCILLFAFLLASAACTDAQSTSTWTTYAAKELPAGKNLPIEEVAQLAEGDLKERTYLIGEFIVTASAQNRAVMRSDYTSPIRLVVVYPDGINPPAEKTKLSRGNANPFLVTDVRKADDGLMTVYAREIVRE